MGNSAEGLPEELITPEMVESFIAETNDLLDNTENNLLEVEKAPQNTQLIDESFRAIHTIKGNAGFFGFSVIETTCMDIETRMDGVRKGSRKADHNFVTELLTRLDVLRGELGQISKGAGESRGTEANTHDGSSAVRPEPPAAEQEIQHDSGKRTEDSGPYRPIGDMLVEMGAVTEDDVREALSEQQKKIGELLVKDGSADPKIIEKVLEEQRKSRLEAEERGQEYKIKRKDIRVDTRRLDKLFDLMGELITAETMVIANPELEGLELENFSRAAASMSKITREMQEITMSIRMIPLEGLFNKMRRLVRDLARKFQKTITLHISGQETEMDRNVIEEISDPLVHIIRNSIDHGVEDEETRKAAGKDPAGNIHLDAKYEGNEIWITIKDDGGGLHREKILKKAQDNGLLDIPGDDMADEDVWKLIFEPGFSTAEKVSEISGRGVGMDVVKRNIDKLRGKIGIESVQGQGTSFILKIPLTLAIIDSINFRVGPMQYCFPIEDIIEFHKAEESRVTKTRGGQEVLRMRNEILPIVKLYQFYNIKTDVTNPAEGLFIIVQASRKRAAVLVDEIIGNRQVVIKPLPDYMGEMRAISGCSIMGGGQISLIVDTSSLLKEILD